jgi:prevent-host-death family protein
MRTAKISELKAKLSAHIGYVKNGEEVLIFDRNTPVARLVPAEPVDDYDEQTRRLIAKGILTPPKRPRKPGFQLPLPPPKGRCIPQEVIDKMWDEEREGR